MLYSICKGTPLDIKIYVNNRNDEYIISERDFVLF